MFENTYRNYWTKHCLNYLNHKLELTLTYDMVQGKDEGVSFVEIAAEIIVISVDI